MEGNKYIIWYLIDVAILRHFTDFIEFVKFSPQFESPYFLKRAFENTKICISASFQELVSMKTPTVFILSFLGVVHTNPFSNENGAVLLRFQKDLRSHLSFSYRFHLSTLRRQSIEKSHGSVCPPFWILTIEWSGGRSCLF